MSLSDLQSDFFRGLRDERLEVPVQGRMDIYQYAYVERIRESVAEDYPRVFAYLESVAEFPGGINSERVTRDLLERNHPHSWTMGEASLPIDATLAALLSAPEYSEILKECRRLIQIDDAEMMASWLEEWPQPRGDKKKWIENFAAGELLLALTKTWRPTPDVIFWRGGEVREANREDFTAFAEWITWVESPVSFQELSDRAAEISDPTQITNFLREGIVGGWLRFTELPA